MGRALRRAGFGLMVLVLVLWSGFPLWYALVTSLSTDTQLFRPHYLPPQLYWGNYQDLFQRSRLLQGMVNSLAIGVIAVALALGFGMMGAYALTRPHLPWRRFVLFAVLATGFFPQVSVLAGMFELYRATGLYNTRLAVVLADLLLLCPFSLWLLSAYLRAFPPELDDMAQIDGASPWQALVHVNLPLMGPGLAATGILGFVAVWNEFLFAFTFTIDTETRTAPVALAVLGGQTPHDLPWGDLMAASVLLSLPPLVLAWGFQRRMISGLAAGSIGG